MPDYTILALGISDLLVSGHDPFGSNSSRTGAAINATTLTLAPGAEWTALVITDNDTRLEDRDSSQDLAAPVVFNNRGWSTGQNVETEYSYVIRPVGATDPSEYITIYVLEFGSQVQGIAADRRLSENVTYEIIAGGSDDPSVLYSDLVTCFTPGTAIATPRGPLPVAALRVGDRVLTADDGAQPVLWIGRQRARGIRAAAPVELAPGVLGNDRALRLSQQHRVLIRAGAGQGLVPVKALLGQPGVALAPCLGVTYYHLLLARHQVIFADGAAVETMYPGPLALRSLAAADRARLRAVLPDPSRVAGARPFLSVGDFARRHPTGGRLRQVALPSRGVA